MLCDGRVTGRSQDTRRCDSHIPIGGEVSCDLVERAVERDAFTLVLLHDSSERPSCLMLQAAQMLAQSSFESQSPTE